MEPREFFEWQAAMILESLVVELRNYKDAESLWGEDPTEENWGHVEGFEHSFWVTVGIARRVGFEVDVDGETMEVYGVRPGAGMVRTFEDWSNDGR